MSNPLETPMMIVVLRLVANGKVRRVKVRGREVWKLRAVDLVGDKQVLLEAADRQGWLNPPGGLRGTVTLTPAGRRVVGLR